MAVQPNNRLRVTTVMAWGAARSVMNVFHVLTSGTLTGDDTDVMADVEEYMSAVYGELDSYISQFLRPVEIRAFNATLNETVPTVPWTSWAGGLSGGEFMPTGVAGLVLFRTSHPKTLGRKFIGGLLDSSVAAGNVTPAAMVALAAWGTALQTGWAGTNSGLGFDYVVRSKTGATLEPTSVTVRSIPAYQRRRREGVGV